MSKKSYLNTMITSSDIMVGQARIAKRRKWFIFILWLVFSAIGTIITITALSAAVAEGSYREIMNAANSAQPWTAPSGVCFVIWIVLLYLTSKMALGVTQKKVIGRYGTIMNAETVDIPIEAVESVEIKRGLTNKLFRDATLKVFTKNITYQWAYVENYVQMKEYIIEESDKAKERLAQKEADVLSDELKKHVAGI